MAIPSYADPLGFLIAYFLYSGFVDGLYLSLAKVIMLSAFLSFPFVYLGKFLNSKFSAGNRSLFFLITVFLCVIAFSVAAGIWRVFFGAPFSDSVQSFLTRIVVGTLVVFPIAFLSQKAYSWIEEKMTGPQYPKVLFACLIGSFLFWLLVVLYFNFGVNL